MLKYPDNNVHFPLSGCTAITRKSYQLLIVYTSGKLALRGETRGFRSIKGMLFRAESETGTVNRGKNPPFQGVGSGFGIYTHDILVPHEILV